MKRLFFGLLFVPFILCAQESDRYLPGAVPEESGKVVFTKEIKAASLTKDQLFDKMLAWAETRFKDENNRVAYQNREKGEIAITGIEKLIFSSTALSLDTSEMSYRIIMECEEGNCSMRLSHITYKYVVSYERNPLRLLAEEVITDKYALNKNGSLNRVNGKFRKATIDYVDKLFDEIDLAFARQGIVSSPGQTSQPSQTFTIAVTSPEKPATPQLVEEKPGYMAFDADKVPEAIRMMLPTSPMRVTAGKSDNPVETNATWKGMSEMFGKNVATITLSEKSPVYRLIDQQFIISFMKEGSETPWMIIECSKQGETTEGNNKTILGEIQQIWIK